MLHEQAPLALGLTLGLAIVARALRAVDTGGAVAGLLVGGLLAATRGLPGLAVLGAFFVLGSLATRVGWARKSAEGTAERGGGARGARRVLGKGGVAALAALVPGAPGAAAVVGALAAALGDTLGTEIGTLARGKPRLLPSFRAVPAGTPGAVSVSGTLALIVGAALVGGAGAAASLVSPRVAAAAVAGGAAGAVLESLLAGAWPGFARAPGTWRNVLTTLAGAVLAVVLASTLLAEGPAR